MSLGTRGELNRAKYYAMSKGLCGEYLNMWNGAKNLEDLFAMGTDANGAGFLCEAIAQPWGWTPSFIAHTFASLINGRHQCKHKGGYTSAVWCMCEQEEISEIEMTATVTILISCHDVTLHIPKHRIGQVYVSGGCDISIVSDGLCRLYVYGTDNILRIEGNVKRVDVPLPTDGSIRNVGERRKTLR